MKQSQRIICILLFLSILTTPITVLFDSRLLQSLEQSGIGCVYSPPIEVITDDFWETECSSVIVTGSAAKDGRAILMKNRDYLLDKANRPYYIPATTKTFAYVTINYNTMGINEKGLAVMNTAMPILGLESGEGNLDLNRLILENFESVDDVAFGLNDTQSPIGPSHRSDVGSIATCVGVVDRFGEGAFFEISNSEAYGQYIVDGYDTRANHPRIFTGYASGPNGRDQYLLDALDEIFAQNGVISWEDVMQNVSRYVHDKELGLDYFTIDGEACNPNTVAAMVAVSGDQRYEGRLNCMWAACGLTPLTGVFVPSMACAGEVPDSVTDLYSYCYDKYQSAQVQEPPNPILLDPIRVREIQRYAFFAEDFTIEEYDKLMHSFPEGLTDDEIDSYLREFIIQMDNYAASVFKGESTEVEVPPSIYFSTPTTSTTTSTSTFPTTSEPGNMPPDQSPILVTAVGMVAGFTIVVLVAFVKWRDI